MDAPSDVTVCMTSLMHSEWFGQFVILYLEKVHHKSDLSHERGSAESTICRNPL